MCGQKTKQILRMLICCLLLSVSIFGCTGENSSKKSKGFQNGDSEIKKEQRYAWPLATASPEDTVTHIFAEKFTEEVKRLSDGAMKIQVYPNSTLGGDRELLESCRDGDIPFVVQNTAPQVTFMPELSIFDLPCVFDTLEECRKKLDDKDFYSLVQKVYEKGGYKLLGMADQGFRVMSSNKNVQKFSDFKGQKIRTMENPYHLEFWKALKSNPTPMSFSEVYIGLQQNTIDAQENPYEVIVSNRLYEQQDYIIETNHLPHLISLVVNDEFYQKLSESQQKIMEEAALTAVKYARNTSDSRIADRIKIIEESGTKIIKLSDELKRQQKEAAASVYKKIEENTDSTLYKAYMKLDR
ncbi:MAG: TRAP transporter substrate-binding protein [Lachnospiraceae bacterium]|nr:TRAP transporter substrate-binding protein [Lachnospiraceae bacterium]